MPQRATRRFRYGGKSRRQARCECIELSRVYDLAAALISQLDLVISVPTTGVQVAGGLGIETWCIVPKYTGWMFAKDTYPWASSVTPLHNPPMRELEERLQGWIQERNTQAA